MVYLLLSLFPDKEARVSAVGKELEVNLNTNIPASDSTRIAMTVDYDKGEEWVSQLLFNKEMDKMQVKVAANEPEVENVMLHYILRMLMTGEKLILQILI